MSDTELRQMVLGYLQERSHAGFYDVLHALNLHAPGQLFPTWEALIKDGHIENASEGAVQSVFWNEYRVRAQLALF